MQATLSHYRILEQIGAGGMGVVFRAHDERLDRDVALKVLPPGTVVGKSARQRFHQEALALSKLNHPNIATVHDFDTQDGTDFLVEELIDGLSLDAMLAAGPLSEKEIIHLGSQLAEGLAVRRTDRHVFFRANEHCWLLFDRPSVFVEPYLELVKDEEISAHIADATKKVETGFFVRIAAPKMMKRAAKTPNAEPDTLLRPPVIVVP